MLKVMRESFHKLKWILIAVVAAFVFGFVFIDMGMGGGGFGGATDSRTFAARVNGETITYNDYYRAPIVPTIATMNRAHPNHYSGAPEPGIKHVLRGWKEGGYAAHDVGERDLRVFNIPTNIRNWGSGATDYAGNSMFVFETAGLCIAHLGHLHHTLTDEHLKRLGPIDIVLIAVDGAVTISQEGAATVIDQIKPKVVIPMHYWGYGSLDRFVSLFAKNYPVKRNDGATVVFSRAALPDKQLLILEGR